MISPPQDPPVLDVEQGLDRLMGNRRIYFLALQRFGIYRAAASQAAALLANGDHDAASRTLHTLKGAAGLLGAVEVHALAGQAEAVLRGRGTIGTLLDDLQAALQRVDARIDSVLADHRAESVTAGEPSPGAAVLLERLARLLDEGDGAATDLVARWEKEFEEAVGAATWRTIVAAMDDYDFERALAALQAAR